MSKYHKKIIEVDAYQLGHGPIPAWFMKAVDEGRIELWPEWTKSPNSRVKTRTDWVEAVLGNYVVLNHRGELQVWNSYEFEKIFEPHGESEKFKAAEQCIAAVRWDLAGDKFSADNIFKAREAIEEYCVKYCGAPASEVKKPELITITKAETTSGLMTGGTISINAEFHGEFCSAQLDEYIEKLQELSAKIKKWRNKEV